MYTNSVIDSRIQRAIKNNAMKDTTVWIVFFAALFSSMIIAVSLIVWIGEYAILIMLTIPAAAITFVFCKRRVQIDEITHEFQNTVENNREYSVAALEKWVGETVKTFSDVGYDYSIAIDQAIQKWILIFPNKKMQYIFDFSELVDFEIYEDGSKLALGTQLIGISIVTFTDVCTNLHVEIVVNASKQSRLVIPLINGDSAHDSSEYKYAADSAKEVCSLLSIIEADNILLRTSNVVAQNEPNQLLMANENDLGNLGKLFELKEQGVITEEEFTSKKKQILGV